MENYPKLVVVGFTNIDINITPSSKTILPGGGSYFASIAASRVTEPVGLVTRIGKDYDPTFLYSRVLKDGINLIHNKPTPRSTQIYHSETDLTDRDMELEWGVGPDINPEDFPKEWLANIEFVHISTMPPKQQAAFITFLRAKAPQAKISIDTDHFYFEDKELLAQIKENFSRADLAFANRHEYTALKEIIDQLPEAIVKFDKDGAQFMKKGKKDFEVTTQEAEVLDATGAGDVLAGTYVGLIMSGKSEHEALEEAVKVATESVKKVGVEHLFIG